MSIEGKRTRYPAAKRSMQNEIQGTELRKLVTDDLAVNDSGEQRPHALHCDLAAQMLKMSGIVSNDRDVADIAFVARPRMSDFAQFHRSYLQIGDGGLHKLARKQDRSHGDYLACGPKGAAASGRPIGVERFHLVPDAYRLAQAVRACSYANPHLIGLEAFG